jgi:hypothetical protein
MVKQTGEQVGSKWYHLKSKFCIAHNWFNCTGQWVTAKYGFPRSNEGIEA